LLKEIKLSELKSLTLTKKLGFVKESMKMTQEQPKNKEFYSNCTAYFEFLRHKGKADYEFEDEYYFTMPAISNQ
jgi:hypothetical protein